MYHHTELGESSFASKRVLYMLIKSGKILHGGYKPDKIYGMLNCKSGMRIKITNRVFFENEQEALRAGYRPCGNCMPNAYKQWKLNQ